MNVPSFPNISTVDLLKLSYDIASGLEYLAVKKVDFQKKTRETIYFLIFPCICKFQVIHGDIAARNILLTADLRGKIGDFGLSRQFMNYSNYFKASKVD